MAPYVYASLVWQFFTYIMADLPNRKMTKCGHIYCWSCISRYLGMAQKGWRKCPICFDSVSTKHLKSTSIELVPEYHEGDHIKFTLMRRHKDCTVRVCQICIRHAA